MRCTDALLSRTSSINLHFTIMLASNKRKGRSKTPIPVGFHGLDGLPRSEDFATVEIDNGRHVDLRRTHLQYYKYEKKKIERLAEEYLFENENKKLLPFLPTLIELQKTRMNPGLFQTLDGNYYQWKYEQVLHAPHISKSTVNESSSKKSESNSNSNSKSNLDETTNKKVDDTTKNDGMSDGNSDDESGVQYIQAGDFKKNFHDLKEGQIPLLLKVRDDFVPWVHFKTVEMEKKDTIGMFASQHFPKRSGIGFYIGHPWLTWPEPFTVVVPMEYDAELQLKHLLPETNAGAYMWFYNDQGYMTCCDPINKPPDLQAQSQSAPSETILGMGFHLVNQSQDTELHNIEIDNNGCVKTTKDIRVGTQLVLK